MDLHFSERRDNSDEMKGGDGDINKPKVSSY